MRLQGKVALVTGGGSGFGAGIVRKFVAEGAKVLVVDRDEAGAQRVAAEVGAAASRFRADVSVAADVRAMFEAAESRFGPLDIVVNNAGVTHLPQPTEAVSEADFDRIAAVNMKAIYLAVREVVPRFKARKAGVILNMASTAGVSPRPPIPSGRSPGGPSMFYGCRCPHGGTGSASAHRPRCSACACASASAYCWRRSGGSSLA